MGTRLLASRERSSKAREARSMMAELLGWICMACRVDIMSLTSNWRGTGLGKGDRVREVGYG